MASLVKSSKGSVVVFFPIAELAALHSQLKLQNLKAALIEKGLTVLDMIFQTPQFNALMHELVAKMSGDRDEHELFVALYGLVAFMGDEIEIGFELKSSFIPNKNTINTVEELNNFRRTDTDIDFLIRRTDGVREFQLKRFKKSLTTSNLLVELEKIIKHYGNKLGDVNLLVIMQSSKTEEIDWQLVSTQIQSILPKDDSAEVLLRFRDNESDIMVRLHPKLDKRAVPIQLPSQILDRLIKKEFTK